MSPLKITTVSLLAAALVVGAGVWFMRRTPAAGESASATAAGKGPPVRRYEDYRFGVGESSKVLDVGMLGESNSMLVLRYIVRDRVLKKQLDEAGWTLREHDFRSGTDMIPFMDGRLDITLMSDVATMAAACRQKVRVTAFVFSDDVQLVALRNITIPELKGQRVAFLPGSVLHYTVEKSLAAAGLSMGDIVPVAMKTDEVEAALRERRIDVAALLDPTLTNVLTRIPSAVAIAKSSRMSFASVSPELARAHPEIEKAFMAAILRAANWSRADEANLRTVLGWLERSPGERQTGEKPLGGEARNLAWLRRQMVENSSYPMLPLDLSGETGERVRQFEFLKRNGHIPPGTPWSDFSSCVDLDLLPGIVLDGAKWEINRFDYASENLYADPPVTP